MALKVQTTLRKLALMLSSGLFGFALARRMDKAAIHDWQAIAADAHQTSAKAIALTHERSEARASRQEDAE